MLQNDLVSGAKGAAEYIGLSERQIYHMTEQGHLPVIRKSELEAAFQSSPEVA